MFNNLLALLERTDLEGAADPVTRLTIDHPVDRTWIVHVALQEGRSASCSGSGLDEAVGAALTELSLGAGIKGRLPKTLHRVMSWLDRGPGRKLDVEWEKELVPASEWDPDADEADDILLTVATLTGGRVPVEGQGTSIRDAIDMCGRSASL